MTPMPNAPNPNAIFGEVLARTPAPLPLSTVQEQMAQTAGLNAQVPIQQQTAQELALKNQLTQRTIRNLQIMHDNAPALLQASGGKWDDSVRNGLISKGMDADEVERVSNQHFVNDQTLANTSHIRAEAEKAALENQDHKASIAAKIAVGMQQAVKPDGSLDLPLIQAQIQTIKAQNPDYDGSGLLALASRDPETFKATMGAALKRAPDVAQAEENVAHTHAQAGLLGAQAQTAAAEAHKVAAEAGMTERELDLMKQATASPGGMSSTVDQLIDPKKYSDINARTKTEFSAAMMLGGPKAAQQVLANAVTHINNLEEGVSKELNPEIRAARIADDVRKAKLLRAGDNPAVARVAPSEIAPATAAANKLDEDYIKAAGSAEALGRFLDLAEKGNVAAGANISLVGVGALNAVNGIRRLNAAEINRYGSAGSLLEKVQGKLRGWTEGVPISSDVINDIREAHQQLAEQSYQNYTNGLNSLNKRTLAEFGPTAPPVNIRKGPTGAPSRTVPPAVRNLLSPKSVAPGVHTLSDGSKWVKAADGTITGQ